MITKDLLFKLLDELEPNQLLGLGFAGRDYATMRICNEKSVMPVITSIRHLDEFYAYRDPLNNFNLEEQIVELDGQQYAIEQEIRDIKFEDEYFIITFWMPDGICTNYYFYKDISTIQLKEEKTVPLAELNRLNYLYNTNK